MTPDLPLHEHQCRHRVITTDSRMVACVGWDRPLNTFFFQLGLPDVDEPTDIDGERMVRWEGTAWDEIPTTDDLLDLIGDDAEIDGDMVKHLEAYQELMPATRRPLFGIGGAGL